MNRRLTAGLTAVLLAICVATTARAATEDLAAVAPADAYAFVSVNQIDQFRERLEATPYARMWDDPEIVRFTQPMRDKIEELRQKTETELKISFDEALELFSGDVAAWILPEDPPVNDGGVGVVILADRDADPGEYRDLLEIDDPDMEVSKSKEDVEGIEVFVQEYEVTVEVPQTEPMNLEGFDSEMDAASEPKTFSQMVTMRYAFPEEMLLVSFDTKSGTDAALRNLLSGGEGLSANPAMRDISSVPEDGRARFLLNLPAIMETAQAAMEDNFDSTDPAQPSPGQIMEGLGLKDLQSAAGVFRVSEIQTVSRMLLRTVENPKGLARAATSFGELDPSIMRAAPEDPTTISAFSFQIPEAYNAIMDAVNATFPQFQQNIAMVSGMIQMQTGMSLDDQIIPAFGDQVTMFYQPSDNEAVPWEMGMAMEMNDSNVINSLLDTLFASNPGMADSIQTSDLMGAKLYSIPMMAQMNPNSDAIPALAVGPGWIVWSVNGDIARESVQRLSGEGVGNYYDNGGFERPASPGTFVGYQSQNWGEVMTGTIQGLQTMAMAPAMMGPDFSGINDLFDFTAVPSQDTFSRYLGNVDTIYYKQGNTVQSETTVPHGME